MKNALALVSHPTSLNVDGGYLQSQTASRARSGESRLMLALLQDGIDCFLRHLAVRDGKSKELFAETERWIFEREIDGVFSFESVCETLGVSASCLRAKIREWKEEDLRKRACKAGRRAPARKRLSPLPRSYSSPGKLTATARA